jgi:hypothetical protein
MAVRGLSTRLGGCPCGLRGYRTRCSGEQGHPWRRHEGTTTASFGGGSFSVSNGSLTCGGGYNALDTSPTISIPVPCSDGRKGNVIATRDNSGMSAGGHFTLSGGTTGGFMFGAVAGKL